MAYTSDTNAVVGGQVAQTPFHHIEGAADAIGAVEGRLRELSTRLLGAQPESLGEGKALPRAVPNGILDSLSATAASLRERADRMHAILEAIERRLP